MSRRTPNSNACSVAVWCDVLGRGAVSVSTTTSSSWAATRLLATQVVSRVRDVTGAELPLTGSCSKSSTVRDAGRGGRAGPLPGASQAAPHRSRYSRDGGRLELSFAQQRLVVPGPARPGQRGLQHPRERSDCAASSTPTRWSPPSARSSSGTRRYALASPARRGHPYQVIDPPGRVRASSGSELGLDVDDDAALESELRQAIRRETHRSFDLELVGRCCGPCLDRGRRSGSCALHQHAPHRQRRLVAGGDGPGIVGALPRARSRGRRSSWSRYRCSTPTTRPGSASGCRARCSRSNWTYWREAAGGESRRRSNCRRTGPGRRPRPTVARGCRSRCPTPMLSSGCARLPTPTG